MILTPEIREKARTVHWQTQGTLTEAMDAALEAVLPMIGETIAKEIIALSQYPLEPGESEYFVAAVDGNLYEARDLVRTLTASEK